MIGSNNGCEKIMVLTFPEMIKKNHEFPISANRPTDLTDVKPVADWNQPNLNEKISQ